MQEIAIMYSAGQYDRILEQYLKECVRQVKSDVTAVTI